MLAIRIHETGGVDTLRVDTVAVPAPGAGEVRLRVEAAGVNFIDTYQRSGLYAVPLPHTLGLEAAGIVTAGDGVVRLWGAERANKSAAANTLEKMGVPWTLSHDAPVTPSPSVLALVDAAVNRRTASGNVIGPDERVTPYAALGAVTRSAAYQIKEERSKGTLEAGKLADMVVLSANPLKVEPATIKDIQVLRTLKEGVTVYEAQP